MKSMFIYDIFSIFAYLIMLNHVSWCFGCIMMTLIDMFGCFPSLLHLFIGWNMSFSLGKRICFPSVPWCIICSIILAKRVKVSINERGDFGEKWHSAWPGLALAWISLGENSLSKEEEICNFRIYAPPRLDLTKRGFWCFEKWYVSLFPP